MTVLIKLGGSLISDKSKSRSYRSDPVRQLARQISRIRQANGQLRIVLGHGSGSFGHFEARKHRTVEGVFSDQQRLGFAQVGAVAAELSMLVLGDLIAAGLPVIRFQPSSTVITDGGRITSFDCRAMAVALDRGMIPLIHGDIALDEGINGTIVSTESLFAHLAVALRATDIILLGEVAGVLDEDGCVIPRITPSSFGCVRSSLAGSRGVDVTGGMLQKVGTMIDLVRAQPSLEVTIADGRRDNILFNLLVNGLQLGTRVSSDAAASSQQ